MADDGRHNSRRLPRQRFSTAMRRRSPLFGYRMARGAACGGRTNRSRDWCCGPPLREAAARPLAREPGYSLTISLRTACWCGTRNRSLIRAPGKPWQYELPFVCRFSSFGGARGAYGYSGRAEATLTEGTALRGRRPGDPGGTGDTLISPERLRAYTWL